VKRSFLPFNLSFLLSKVSSMFTTVLTPCRGYLPFFFDPLMREVLVKVLGVSITIGYSLSSPFFLFKLLEVALVLVEGALSFDGGELVVSVQNIDVDKIELHSLFVLLSSSRTNNLMTLK